MAKKRQPKRKKRKSKSLQPPPIGLASNRWLRRRATAKTAAKAVFVVATLVGGISGVASLLPRVSLSSEESLDVSDPFSTPFVVSNEGLLDLNDVKIFCGVERVVALDGHVEVQGPGNYGAGFPVASFAAERIEPGQKQSFVCKFHLPKRFPVNYADIAVAVSFRPEWGIWRKEKLYGFHTVRSLDGTLHWLQHPANESTRSPSSDKTPRPSDAGR